MFQHAFLSFFVFFHPAIASNTAATSNTTVNVQSQNNRGFLRSPTVTQAPFTTTETDDKVIVLTQPIPDTNSPTLTAQAPTNSENSIWSNSTFFWSLMLLFPCICCSCLTLRCLMKKCGYGRRPRVANVPDAFRIKFEGGKPSFYDGYSGKESDSKSGQTEWTDRPRKGSKHRAWDDTQSEKTRRYTSADEHTERERSSKRRSESAHTATEESERPQFERRRSEPSLPTAVPFEPTDRPLLFTSSLFAELIRRRGSDDVAARKRYFKEQCLRWHPDKNVGNEENATKMFQLLQDKKKWFLDPDA